MKEWKYYSGSDLKDYVISSKNKREILKENEFKDYLLKAENHYAFVWLVQDLDLNDTMLLLDNVFLEKIIEVDNRATDKFNAILESKAEILLSINDKILEYILDNESLYFLFSDFNAEVADKLFDLIITKRTDKISCFTRFSPKIQEKLLTIDNIEKLNFVPKFLYLISSLSGEAILKLLPFEKYKEVIRNFSKDSMIAFTENTKHIDMSNYLLNDNSFILSIATLEDPNYYRHIINNLLCNNYKLVEKTEKYRLKYIQNQFNMINENGIFQNYEYIKNYVMKNGMDSIIFNKIPSDMHMLSDFSDENLLKLTNRRKFEMLCDVYFKDYARNVLFNLKEIIKYNEDKNIIPEARKNLYMMFLRFNELTNQEINLLVQNMSSEDYSTLLYEDIINCKNASYNSYNDEFIKLDKSSNLYNEAYSKQKDVDIYNLNGEDFLACVHCGYFNRENVDNKTISLSLIGAENVGVFISDGLILGFNHLTPQKIMHVYNSDSFTTKSSGTNRVNKIYTSQDLLNETYFYNEVLYSEQNGNNLTADYVVCMDRINDKTYEYAKVKNIPILIINREKYKINRDYFEPLNYQDSFMTERGDYFAK